MSNQMKWQEMKLEHYRNQKENETTFKSLCAQYDTKWVSGFPPEVQARYNDALIANRKLLADAQAAQVAENCGDNGYGEDAAWASYNRYSDR